LRLIKRGLGAKGKGVKLTHISPGKGWVR
jgi:hypothetical protein